MLSSGMLPPESRSIGTASRMNSRPSCGIERAIVPGRGRSRWRGTDRSRCRQGTAGSTRRSGCAAIRARRGRATEPAPMDDHESVGPDFRHRDLERGHRHDQQVVHRAVLALAHDGGAGQDDRQHRRLSVICITLVNHAVSTLGLKAMRTTRLTGVAAGPSPRETKLSISVVMICRHSRPRSPPAPSPSHRRRAESAGCRAARTSRSKFGGMSMTKVYRPAFISGTICRSAIGAGVWK